MTHGFRLRRDTTAGDVHLDIERPALRRGVEGLLDDHAEHITREVVLEGAAVDLDGAFAALAEEDPRDGVLALACAVETTVDDLGSAHVRASCAFSRESDDRM